MSGDYIAHLTNCLLMGEEVEALPDGSWYRSLIRLDLEGFKVELREYVSVINRSNWPKLRGQNILTTEVTIREITPADQPKAEAIARNLSELLTFATCSEVGVARFEYAPGNPPGAETATVGQLNRFLPVIDTAVGEAVHRFLDGTWVRYGIERDRRNLPAVFHYFALAGRDATPVELQLAILFIILEQLKHSYATLNHYPFFKGSFWEPGTTKAAASANGSLRRGLADILKAMLGDVGMTPDLGPVVKLRNDILHSGLSAQPFRELETMSGEIEALIREYLLRLLGYTGWFYNGMDGGVRVEIV
jgi:hypothetical protein